ncbi:hypothetical protein MTO96_033551 [Rhipicephalus appendiculatus]
MRGDRESRDVGLIDQVCDPVHSSASFNPSSCDLGRVHAEPPATEGGRVFLPHSSSSDSDPRAPRAAEETCCCCALLAIREAWPSNSAWRQPGGAQLRACLLSNDRGPASVSLRSLPWRH